MKSFNQEGQPLKSKEDIALSIIIVNYNAKDYLFKTLESVRKNIGDLDYEVIVVDNASTDGSVEGIKKSFPAVKLIALDQNTGFAKANNEGAKRSLGRYLLIMNNDTDIPKGTVEKLMNIKEEHPEYGIVAPLTFNLDNTLLLNWGKDLHLLSEIVIKFFLERWYRWLYTLKKERISREVDWVSGACFLIERNLYQKINGFDEKYFLYVEDADFGKRVRHLGYKIHLTSDAHITHHLGRSTSRYIDQILPEIKKSQLYYYCVHNSRQALRILKFYLWLRFHLKRFYFRLKNNSEKRESCERVLTVVREFSCEDYS